MKVLTLVALLGVTLGACRGDRADVAIAADESGRDVRADTSEGEAAVPAEESPAGDSTPEGRRGMLRGRIELTGTAEMPWVLLTDATGRRYTLTGALRDELARISGATVRLTGSVSASDPGGRFAVEDYVVLEIDGERPLVGTLAERGGDLQLLGPDSTTTVLAAPAELRGAIGAKVWILGPVADRAVRVSSFGVIRDPD